MTTDTTPASLPRVFIGESGEDQGRPGAAVPRGPMGHGRSRR